MDPVFHISRWCVLCAILVKHFKSSNTQADLLADSVEEELIPTRKFQGLPVLSNTRWLTRVDSIDCLLQNYRSVCGAVEIAQLGGVQVMLILTSSDFYHLSF